MKKFYLLSIVLWLYRPASGHSFVGSQLLNAICNLENKYVDELAEAIKIQHTQINITYVLTTSKLNTKQNLKQAKYKKRNRMTQSIEF